MDSKPNFFSNLWSYTSVEVFPIKFFSTLIENLKTPNKCQTSHTYQLLLVFMNKITPGESCFLGNWLKVKSQNKSKSFILTLYYL